MNRSKKQKAWILPLTCFLALLTAAAWQRRPAATLAQSADNRPNILFAVADDQSWPARRSDDPWDHYQYFGRPGKMPGNVK